MWPKPCRNSLSWMGLSVFYDKSEQADLWGSNLIEKLQYVYRDASSRLHCLCVTSLCKQEMDTPRAKASSRARLSGLRRLHTALATLTIPLSPVSMKRLVMSTQGMWP